MLLLFDRSDMGHYSKTRTKYLILKKKERERNSKVFNMDRTPCLNAQLILSIKPTPWNC